MFFFLIDDLQTRFYKLVFYELDLIRINTMVHFVENNPTIWTSLFYKLFVENYKHFYSLIVVITLIKSFRAVIDCSIFTGITKPAIRRLAY